MRRAMQAAAFLFMLFFILVPLSSSALPENAEIRGTVWIDSNTNGRFEQGENGLKNCTLILYALDQNGNASEYSRTASEKNGVYAFDNVAPGQYQIFVSLSGDYRFTLPGLESAALPASGKESYTVPFTVPSLSVKQIDIGITKASSSISLVAFEDLNANGGRMNTEPLMRNVHIELQYEANGTVYTVGAVDTNREGEARFASLSPAAYRVAVTAPEGFGFGPLGQKINLWYNCIPSNGTPLGLSDVIELGPKDKAALGIGLVRTGAVSGSLWFDANASGTADAGEGGLEGIAVTLSSASAGIEATVLTDRDGIYRFSSLPAGTYQITVTLPDEYMFSSQNASSFSTASPRSATSNVTAVTGSVLTVEPLGVMPDTAVAVTVFLDLNANGFLDNGESLMPSVRIGLTNGGQAFESVTDAMGSCLFRGLRGAASTLSCTLPEGYIFTSDGGDSLLTVSNGSTYAEAAVQTAAGTTEAFMIGATLPSSVSGTLFEDSSFTGHPEDASVYLADFKVLLLDAQGKVRAETLTDGQGQYLFSLLPGGQYRVRFVFNDPYIASTAAADSPSNAIAVQNMDYGETSAFELSPGSTAVKNGALYQAGSIEGHVYLNPAYDALKTREGGLENVRIVLLNEQGVQVSDHLSDTTDSNGYFYLKGVDPGIYTLSYEFPDGSVMVTPDLGASLWTSAPLQVSQGTLSTVPDTGAVLTSVLSGTVRPAEGSVNTGSFPGEITLQSETFGTVMSRTLDENGKFAFNGLLPDTYHIKVTLEDGCLISGSSRDLVPMSLSSSSENTLHIDMGSDWTESSIFVSLPSSLDATVYFDRDNSLSRDMGNDSPAANRSMRLTGPDGERTVSTDEQGHLLLSPLFPGDYVLTLSLAEDEILQGHPEWMEKAEISFTLTDGETTFSEVPLLTLGAIEGQVWNLDGNATKIADLPISLVQNGETVMETRSGKDGSFRFGRLYPGVYSLSAKLPELYIFARKQDAKERTSVILNTGSTEIRLAMGDKLFKQDIGIGAVGGIGDMAWLDENKNGLQDIGETGIPGLLIELYQYGELIASTNTDVYGRYDFRDLYPGTYTMLVTVPEELKSTRHRTDFPLVNSILPEGGDSMLRVEEIIIPSGSFDMNCDLGFVLKTDGVYPASMRDIPERNWTPYSDR